MEWLPESIGVLVAFAITVSAVYLSIMKNLPRNLGMMPIGEREIPLDLFPQMACYEDLGFERLGAWRVYTPTRPTIVTYHRPGEGTFGMVFSFPKMPGKVYFDFTTALAPEPCMLTSGMHIGGGSLTLPDPAFLQLFPGASVEDLYAAHQESVAYLCSAGLALPPPDPDRFEERLRASIRRQREVFGRAPMRNTLISLWRVVSRSSPYRGPVRAQKATRRKIDAAMQHRVRCGGTASRDQIFEYRG